VFLFLHAQKPNRTLLTSSKQLQPNEPEYNSEMGTNQDYCVYLKALRFLLLIYPKNSL